MGVLSLSGAIVAGPPTAGEGFPAMLANVPLILQQGSQKSFQVATGVLSRIVSSPSAFVALQGVGATDTVTKGDTLYFKSNGSIDLRLTQDDGSGASVVKVVPVSGLVLIEFPTAKFLKLLEAQGSATVEYFVSGQS